MLAHQLQFSADQDEAFFEELPAAPAVFLLRGGTLAAVQGDAASEQRSALAVEGQPYVSKTANLRRRLRRLLGTPTEQSKRLNLRDRVREIEFTATGSEFESQFVLYKVLRETFPKTYAARLRLRPAPLVKLHLENEYPRASVTTRLGKIRQAGSEQGADSKTNLYYGPFLSRTAAEKFANDALDLFKMRRCVDDLHPDPAFPGCVYSEMKMCLAPCFKGCTDDEYRHEVDRVQAFFDTSGESLVRELTQQRDQASADLAFEVAAATHAKLEKLKPVLSQLPEIVHRIDQLRALVIQKGTEPGAVVLFQFAEAAFGAPLTFNVELKAESRSLESQIEELLGKSPAPQAVTATERMEHLAILKRWYYRSTRVGEIFFADENGTWPLRRIVRGIGRVRAGEKEQAAITFSATEDPSLPS